MKNGEEITASGREPLKIRPHGLPGRQSGFGLKREDMGARVCGLENPHSDVGPCSGHAVWLMKWCDGGWQTSELKLCDLHRRALGALCSYPEGAGASIPDQTAELQTPKREFDELGFRVQPAQPCSGCEWVKVFGHLSLDADDAGNLINEGRDTAQAEIERLRADRDELKDENERLRDVALEVGNARDEHIAELRAENERLQTVLDAQVEQLAGRMATLPDAVSVNCTSPEVIAKAAKVLAAEAAEVATRKDRGAEAEALRAGIERIIREYAGEDAELTSRGYVVEGLQELLDTVDAEESLAHLIQRDGDVELEERCSTLDAKVCKMATELSDLKEDRRSLGTALAEARQELRSFHEQLGQVMEYRPDCLPAIPVLLEKLQRWSYGDLQKELSGARAEAVRLRNLVNEREIASVDARRNVERLTTEMGALATELDDWKTASGLPADYPRDVTPKDLRAHINAFAERAGRYRAQRDDAKHQLRHIAAELAVEATETAIIEEVKRLSAGLLDAQCTCETREELLDFLKEAAGASCWGEIGGVVKNIRNDRDDLKVEVRNLRAELRDRPPVDAPIAPGGCASCIYRVNASLDVGDGKREAYRGCMLTVWEHDGVPQNVDHFDPAPPWCPGFVAILGSGKSSLGTREPVWGSRGLYERLELGKYTKWATRLTAEELEGVLWLVGEYVMRLTSEELEDAKDSVVTSEGGIRRRYSALVGLMLFWHRPVSVDLVRQFMRNCMKGATPWRWGGDSEE